MGLTFSSSSRNSNGSYSVSSGRQTGSSSSGSSSSSSKTYSGRGSYGMPSPGSNTTYVSGSSGGGYYTTPTYNPGSSPSTTNNSYYQARNEYVAPDPTYKAADGSVHSTQAAADQATAAYRAEEARKAAALKAEQERQAKVARDERNQTNDQQAAERRADTSRQERSQEGRRDLPFAGDTREGRGAGLLSDSGQLAYDYGAPISQAAQYDPTNPFGQMLQEGQTSREMRIGGPNALSSDVGMTYFDANKAPELYSKYAAEDRRFSNEEDQARYDASRDKTRSYLTMRTLQNTTADDPILAGHNTDWSGYENESTPDYAAAKQAGMNIDAMAGADINAHARGLLTGAPFGDKVRHAGNTTYAAEADNGVAGVAAGLIGAFIPGAGLIGNGVINAGQGEEFNDAIFNQPMTFGEKFAVGAESALTNAMGLDGLRNADPNAFYSSYGQGAPSDLSDYGSADEYLKAKGIDPESEQGKAIQDNWDFWAGYDSHLKNMNQGSREKTYRKDSVWGRGRATPFSNRGQ